MRNRTWAVCGVLALTLSGPVVTGCAVTKGGKPKATASSSPAPKPQEELASAVKVFATDPYHYQGTDGSGIAFGGDVIPMNKAATLTIAGQSSRTGPAKATIMQVGSNLYVKVSAPGKVLPGTENAHGRWLQMDRRKFKDPRAVLIPLGTAEATDPFDAMTIARDAVSVKKVDETHFTGTADVSNVSGLGVGPDDAKALGTKVRSIPFEATIDDQHRLTSMKITVPPGGEYTKTRVMIVTYRGFGQHIRIDKPAADQVMPAPRSVYEVFDL